MKRLWVAASALTAGLLLSACGSSGPASPAESPGTSSAQPGPTAATPTSPGTPVPGPSSEPGTPTRTPPGAAPSAGTTTLSGTVRAGVEANCLLLEGYLLLGGPPDVLSAGARVTVTGEVRGDLMTTCQQGTPFMVRTATRG